MPVDVIVVGAGPAGCVAALEQARLGRRVMLLEAADGRSSKLAGEWIHPPGVAVLDRLGVNLSHASRGRGFVVYPDDATGPVVLDYPGSGEAVSCDHQILVEVLRRKVTEHQGIDLITGARVLQVVGGHQVVFEASSGSREQTSAELIVGADGRASVVRQATGLSCVKRRLSRMAGLLLRDVELPFEDYGHVLLGGPGPVLLYRLGPGEVRVCLDVPASVADLCEPYSRAFPPSLRPAFQAAVGEQRVRWAANFSAPRVAYGSGRLALVGDATGLTHPLTAAGLTQSFADGACLARAESVASYARRRQAETRVPGMLASSLYEIFTSTRQGDVEIRRAIYHVWRASPGQRTRTMRLLSTQDTGRRQFLTAFLKVMVRASLGLPRNPAAVKSYVQWLLWLGRESVV